MVDDQSYDKASLTPLRGQRGTTGDNAGPGSWFLTVKAHGDYVLFGDVIHGRMHLNELGRIVHGCWLDVPLHFPHVARDAWIVVPNHFHALLRLVSCDFTMERRMDRVERFAKPVKGSVATVVRSFKSAATRAIRERVGRPLLVWQPGYWDERVFGELELCRVRKYIANNPAKWEESPRNRPYVAL